MKITSLFENDSEHHKTLMQTGYWGKRAAGLIFFSRATQRFCLSLRSQDVLEPGTWGTWGGASDDQETPEQTARREAVEETGVQVKLQNLIHIDEFVKPNFMYDTFVGIVENEFEPTTDSWETDGHIWTNYGEWPEPLHPGLKTSLGKSSVNDILKNLLLAK